MDYFIDTCADEVSYMSNLLEPSGVLQRLKTFVLTEAERNKIDIKTYEQLARMFMEGAIPKAAVAAILGVSDRKARRTRCHEEAENKETNVPRAQKLVTIPHQLLADGTYLRGAGEPATAVA